jgi:Abortive infection C-terminus
MLMGNRPDDLAVEVEMMQNTLLSRATGGRPNDTDYIMARDKLIRIERIGQKLPRFVHTCADLDQFWNYIKLKFPSYVERREHVRSQFQPLLEMLNAECRAPGDDSLSSVLTTVDSDHVRKAWSKAIERRATDPEGAITAARTLIESVCKHVLDERSIDYDDDAKLPKLYHLVSVELDLAPNQRTEPLFRQVLGGCQTIVEGLGPLRNKLSDAHGGGKSKAIPSSRHAELAVNLSGAMATFLLATLEAGPVNDGTN